MVTTPDADIVCSRAKNHYDPQGGLALSESATRDTAEAASDLENFKRAYKPLHKNQTTLMYFSVSINTIAVSEKS
jgi:eukaryotic translation initiation factor 2C